jgi:hypothetical protein
MASRINASGSSSSRLSSPIVMFFSSPWFSGGAVSQSPALLSIYKNSQAVIAGEETRALMG